MFHFLILPLKNCCLLTESKSDLFGEDEDDDLFSGGTAAKAEEETVEEPPKAKKKNEKKVCLYQYLNLHAHNFLQYVCYHLNLKLLGQLLIVTQYTNVT